MWTRITANMHNITPMQENKNSRGVYIAYQYHGVHIYKLFVFIFVPMCDDIRLHAAPSYTSSSNSPSNLWTALYCSTASSYSLTLLFHLPYFLHNPPISSLIKHLSWTFETYKNINC